MPDALVLLTYHWLSWIKSLKSKDATASTNDFQDSTLLESTRYVVEKEVELQNCCGQVNYSIPFNYFFCLCQNDALIHFTYLSEIFPSLSFSGGEWTPGDWGKVVGPGVWRGRHWGYEYNSGLVCHLIRHQTYDFFFASHWGNIPFSGLIFQL